METIQTVLAVGLSIMPVSYYVFSAQALVNWVKHNLFFITLPKVGQL
jgi:hypothetical protein